MIYKGFIKLQREIRKLKGLGYVLAIIGESDEDYKKHKGIMISQMNVIGELVKEEPIQKEIIDSIHYYYQEILPHIKKAEIQKLILELKRTNIFSERPLGQIQYDCRKIIKKIDTFLSEEEKQKEIKNDLDELNEWVEYSKQMKK